ncbi:arginine--tRNA ligase [Agriterribacter sp.]|uniref:arginine--tRNA ligase n=1 Tax=Agriterribacter sp. TaxID=2821509 RepID=UPI002D128EA3|nr:arginine--tRNA ligase [Agriterribacter sp.]HRP56120.1 arginine--tRNA ligase [Agriterribacter sp.]
MSVTSSIQQAVIKALAQLYNQSFSAGDFQINQTKPEFEGDYTVVLFSLLKPLKQAPDALGKALGEHLIQTYPSLFSSFNVIKGFLNLGITGAYWTAVLNDHYRNDAYGRKAKNGKTIVVEYASPNTNKPLHLGHLRNIFLGWSVSEILKAEGYDVVKTCIANDRGIHICKSMVAWQKFANGATPESTGIKGDHFVGDYYVRFGTEFKKEVQALKVTGMSEEAAEKEAPIMKAAQQMLVDWEAGKPDVIALWKKMNGWVYAGFDITYKRIGSDFDKMYYESDTYLLGKKLVEEGLQKGVFFKKEDSSVWVDLTAEGLDEKIVQRKDGTAVYITQDIGLAVNKYEAYRYDQSIYVVGDEQNYHFKVLKLICEKLGLPSSEGIYHLSYGMVELPSGRMKTREGTVVDADDIIDEMIKVAAQKTEELGKVKDFTAGELVGLYNTIGLGALKFFILRVDPRKRMIFNPEESIDFHGFTASFVQFSHARAKAILRNEQPGQHFSLQHNEALLPLEKELIILLEKYPAAIQQAAFEHNPSVIVNYCYELAKTFNSFVTEHRVLKAETENKKQLRLRICRMTANVIASGMGLAGIEVPERM